jgi:hypothetical protein
VESQPDPEDPNAEPDPTEAWRRFWKYVADSKNSGAITAIATLAICVTGVCYTIFAGFQWSTNQESANAAKSAADTSAKQLELLDRPWISVAFTPESPIAPVIRV